MEGIGRKELLILRFRILKILYFFILSINRAFVFYAILCNK